jgi:hypothetical protein
MQGRKALPNSMKDPFYSERAKFIEERRRKHLEYYSSQADKNASKYREYLNSQQSQQSDTESRRYEPPAPKASKPASKRDTQQFLQKESILNLLTKNLASNPIYEEDEDQYVNNNTTNKNNGRREDPQDLNEANNTNKNTNYLSKSNSSSIEDLLLSNRGYVPFMRTNDLLDPVHAGSPVPSSRESSAVKKSREKARQVRRVNISRCGD